MFYKFIDLYYRLPKFLQTYLTIVRDAAIIVSGLTLIILFGCLCGYFIIESNWIMLIISLIFIMPLGCLLFQSLLMKIYFW